MISPASLSEKVTAMYLAADSVYTLASFLALWVSRTLSLKNDLREASSATLRAPLVWTDYMIKDDNAFVLFSPRFTSTAFFYDMGSVFLIAYFYTDL